MKVSKLMRPDVITCRTIDSLERAAQLMWDHDIGCVPVIDENGRVAGMITDRDICMAAYTRGAPLRAIPVVSTMARDVYSCGPDDDLASVEREMGRHQIRRMPVIDAHGQPIGIVSLNDIARASQGANSVSMKEVATTLAAICAPRQIAVETATS
jgi:CBS domain-containing protein